MRARLTGPGRSVRNLWFQDLLVTIASIPIRVMVMTSLNVMQVSLTIRADPGVTEFLSEKPTVRQNFLDKLPTMGTKFEGKLLG